MTLLKYVLLYLEYYHLGMNISGEIKSKTLSNFYLRTKD